jgi:hypothetical protein
MSEGLYPPDGAEPGSWWTMADNQQPLCWRPGYLGTKLCWVDTLGAEISAEKAWRYGFRLADPHGLAEAHARLKGWVGDDETRSFKLQSTPYCVEVQIWDHEDNYECSFHCSSAIAAVKQAIAQYDTCRTRGAEWPADDDGA